MYLGKPGDKARRHTWRKGAVTLREVKVPDELQNQETLATNIQKIKQVRAQPGLLPMCNEATTYHVHLSFLQTAGK